MKIDINFSHIFLYKITYLVVKHSPMKRKLNIMTVQVEKSCYKLTNFSSAINRNRFQLSPQFNSSRSSYDVILVTFHDVSQSKSYMDFALLQVSWESISRIFFRVNAQTETVDAFEYPQRRFLVPMRHDYIIKPVSTLKRHEVAESLQQAYEEEELECFQIKLIWWKLWYLGWYVEP